MSGESPLVHVVDPSGPGGSRWLAAIAARAADGIVVALGAADDSACRHRVPVASSRRATVATLERLLEGLRCRTVIAWGSRSAGLACEARDHAARWLVVDAVPATTTVAFDAEVTCVDAAVADALARAGWPPMRLRVQSMPPPVFPVWDDSGEIRSAVRSVWGASPDTLVVGLVPAGPEEGDAMTALDVVGRASLTGVDTMLVLHPRTGGAADMQVFARRAGLRARVRFDDALGSPGRAACGVDVWLSLPDLAIDGTALHPTLVGGLGGCLLAAAGSCACAEIEPGIDAEVARGCDALAAALVALAESPDRRRSLAASARVRHAATARTQAFEGLRSAMAARAGIAREKAAAAPA